MFNQISHVKMGKFLGYSSADWGINPENQITFLIGPNGSGKITLMRHMMFACRYPEIAKNQLGIELEFVNGSKPDEMDVTFIDTIVSSPYVAAIYIKGEYNRLQEFIRETNNHKHYETIQKALDGLLGVKRDGETIIASDGDTRFIVDDSGILALRNNEPVGINALSSGHVRLLYMILAVANAHYKKSVVFIDKPETSQHISVEDDLCDAFKKIAPHNQFIIKTHSPGIVVGRLDNVAYMNRIGKK